MTSFYSEDILVEQPAMALFETLSTSMIHTLAKGGAHVFSMPLRR
jgi:hypothetical protein